MRFGVLGPLAVWTADGEPVTVPELKVRALLAALLVDPGHVVSSDRLVDFLWDEKPPANPAAAIQTRVSRLRKVLAASGGGELVEHRAPGYRLAIEPELVDAGRFTARLGQARDTSDARARRELLTAALDLWRGEAFTDFADSQFVRPAIVRLTEQRLLAVEELATARIELGEPGDVVAELSELVGSHPRRERLRAVHMRALYQSGRQAEALDSYHELRRHLGEELGLDPAPELAEMYGRILRQEPATRFTAAGVGSATDQSGGAVLSSAPGGGRRHDIDGDPARAEPSHRPVTAGADDVPPRSTNAADGRAAMVEPDGTSPPSAAELDGRTELSAGVAARDVEPIRGSTPSRSSAGAAARDVEPFRESTVAEFDGRSGRDAARSATVRGNLPRPLTSLIGRDTELAELERLPREHRLVTLTGMGGVGKTSLALESARQAAETIVDGTWLVELAGLPETTTPARLAEVVAETLGIRDDQSTVAPHGSGDPVARLSEALRPRHTRLLLDNCEHVVHAASSLAETLLRAAPDLSILATSQEPLGVAGEQLVAVNPLRPADAVRLFTARARSAAPGFTVTDADTLAAICDRLDGIPLALELAANRIRVLGLTELAQRLEDRFGLLTGGRRDAPARQQTLRAMLDWSWELLTAAERIVLRRLAIHADGCTLAAAEATCAVDGVQPNEVLDLLARLVDRSLVNVSYGTDGPRYRLLESVAAYCVDRLRADNDHTPARRVHAEYYIGLAERTDPRLRGPRQDQALLVLDTESANLRFAFDTVTDAGWRNAPAADGRGSVASLTTAEATGPRHDSAVGVSPGAAPPSAAERRGGPAASDDDDCGASPADAALRLVNALSWYWFLRGRLAEPRRMLARALSTPDTSGPRYARALVGQYAIRLLAGDTEVITDAFADETSRAFDRIADPGQRGRSQWFLAHAVGYFGDPDLAGKLLEQAMATFAPLDDSWGHAAVTYSQAAFQYDRGELATARDQAERGRELFAQAGDRWGQSQAGTLLGRLAEVDGDYARAADRHRTALRLAEQLGLWSAVATGFSELGRIALLTNDLAQAAAHHEHARRIAVEHADEPAREYAELGLALGARRQRNLDEAESYLLRWLDWNRELDTDFGLALILAELGFVAELRGDAETALSYQSEGLRAARRTGNPRAVALALEGLAAARSVAGQDESAARLLGAATALRESLAAPLPPAERGDVDRVAARLREALGDNRVRQLLAEGATLDVDGFGADGQPPTP